MLYSLTANHATFQEVTFTPGLNVVLAERTKESTKKDSRNGLGKSTLIDIIHFCLGGESTVLRPDVLPDWAFTLGLSVGGTRILATRSTERSRYVEISGDVSAWPERPSPNLESGALEYPVRVWTALLGHFMFDLPLEGRAKYAPTFRSLVSYFARRGRDAYSTPFETHRKQPAVQTQVDNAYLLHLNAEYAQEVQRLKDEESALKQLKKAAKSGYVAGIIGSIGELEARRVRLRSKSTEQADQLATFRVHPQYATLQDQANQLTERLAELRNTDLEDSRLLGLYRANITDESVPQEDAIVRLYAQAGVDLPDKVVKTLDDVKVFHKRLVSNRRDYLRSEIDRLERESRQRQDDITRLSEDRAALMKTLQTHKALEEYAALQQLHTGTVEELKDVERRLEKLREVEARSTQLSIDKQTLLQSARRDLQEREAQRTNAVELFNFNSEALYRSPGTLVIEMTENGFSFDVEIASAASTGISNMKVFCYDLSLAQIWADRARQPGFLIHDSIIFDGVDERQRALAIELAARESEVRNFQYICTLNSDNVPRSEFPPEFDFDNCVRLRLTDRAGDQDRLLGIQFDVSNQNEV